MVADIAKMTKEEYDNMIGVNDGSGFVRRSIARGYNNYRTYNRGKYRGNNRVYRQGLPEFYAWDEQEPHVPEKKVSLEELMVHMLTINNQFMATSSKQTEETEAVLLNRGASLTKMANQLGQIAKVLQERFSGTLPSFKETIPREQVNAITTRIEEEDVHDQVSKHSSLRLRLNKLVFP